MANTGGSASASGEITATTDGVNTPFGGIFSQGYIANRSSTIEITIYLDETADVASKAQKIPALGTFDWKPRSNKYGGHSSFRAKTGSSTALVYYHAEE